MPGADRQEQQMMGQPRNNFVLFLQHTGHAAAAASVGAGTGRQEPRQKTWYFEMALVELIGKMERLMRERQTICEMVTLRWTVGLQRAPPEVPVFAVLAELRMDWAPDRELALIAASGDLQVA